MKHEIERRHVVDLCLRLSERGYFAGTGGNLMLRIDRALVAVTPSATDYLVMRPEDVCVLRLADLAVVDDASGGCMPACCARGPTSAAASTRTSRWRAPAR